MKIVEEKNVITFWIEKEKINVESLIGLDVLGVTLDESQAERILNKLRNSKINIGTCYIWKDDFNRILSEKVMSKAEIKERVSTIAKEMMEIHNFNGTQEGLDRVILLEKELKSLGY